MVKGQNTLDGLRICCDCEKSYPLNTDNFYKTGAGYFYSYCRSCFALRQKKYKEKGKTTNRGRQSTKPDENGNLTCRACLTVLPANKDNFYSYQGKFIPECKPCRLENERERYAKNRLTNLRRNLLQKAAETKEELSICLKCNQKAPVSSFVEWDTNVYYNNKILIKGYKYICGVCKEDLNDKIFSQIAGSFELHKKKTGYVHKRKDRKSNKAKIS